MTHRRRYHLSPLQKQAIETCAKGLHPGTVEGVRLGVLERRGLMRWKQTVEGGFRWELTDEGRRALRGERPPKRPIVTVEGMSYSMTVQVNDGPRHSFAGSSLAELERDLAEAASELGKGSTT